jgi:hypothetical protein
MQTISMTYEQLADRLGVKYESARKTTQRRRWRKSRGNDGHTRVEVPLEELPPIEEPVIPPPSYEEILSGLKEQNARLEAETMLLREMLMRADTTAEEHKAMVEHWRAQMLKWQDEAAHWQAEYKAASKAARNDPARHYILNWFRRKKANGKGD